MPILVSSLVVWAGLLTISRALLLTTGIDPWAFTFIQMLSGGVTLLIFAWRPGMSWRAGGRPLTWLFGLSRVTSAACFTAALVYVSLVEASLLGLMSVTGAALMAWRLRGARPGRAEFVCHTILVAGVVSLALLVEDGWRNPAVLLMAVSELAVIASTFTAEYHPENQTEDPRARLWLTGIALSVTAAMMLTARLGQTTLWADGEVAEIWQAARDWRLWLIGGAVGVVLRGPATFLAFWAIHRHGADAYILATALLPVFGLTMEWALAQPGWVPPITLTLPVYAVGTAMIAALVTLALARLRAGRLSPKT